MPTFGSLTFLSDVGRVDPALRLVVGLIAHRPREVLRVVPLGGAGGHEELRHLLLVQVLLDGGVGRGAERLEDEGDLVLLDELAHHLDRLGRAIGVVVADEVDLAAVDAALVVDLLEVRGDGLADRPVGRGVAAVRVGVADLDLGGRDAHHRLGRRAAGDEAGHAEADDEGQEPLGWTHGVLPFELSVVCRAPPAVAPVTGVSLLQLPVGSSGSMPRGRRRRCRAASRT